MTAYTAAASTKSTESKAPGTAAVRRRRSPPPKGTHRTAARLLSACTPASRPPYPAPAAPPVAPVQENDYKGGGVEGKELSTTRMKYMSSLGVMEEIIFLHTVHVHTR